MHGVGLKIKSQVKKRYMKFIFLVLTVEVNLLTVKVNLLTVKVNLLTVKDNLVFTECEG